ncbi:protocadherin Fat 4-like, partial [Argonauta hians]
CVQFFNGTIQHPLYLQVLENAAVGSVIQQFQSAQDDTHKIFMTEGDTEYLRYDSSTESLVVNGNLKTRSRSVLYLSGICIHVVKSYNHVFNLTLQIFVNVTELNDPPFFTNLPNTQKLSEKTAVGEEIYQVEGGDLHDVSRSPVTYKLLGISNKNTRKNLDDVFTMDGSGKVFLRKPLDFDHGLRSYELDIQITDSDPNPLTNVSKLTIQVVDEDDRSPKFSHKQYKLVLIGEKPVVKDECVEVTPKMKAVDQDPVKKSPIKYIIIDGSPPSWKNYFRMQEDDGTLCQLKTIERISASRGDASNKMYFPSFELTVKAYQTDNHLRKDTVKLNIQVVDQNLHAPVFSKKLYRADINEYPSLKLRDLVINVTAIDQDYGRNKMFHYEIVKNFKNGFKIDKNTGSIYVSRPSVVDRELEPNIQLEVRAVETQSEEKKVSSPNARIFLKVKDINDNSPTFKKQFYKYDIKDNTPFNDLVHPPTESIKAFDPDLAENGTLTYTIIEVTRNEGETSFNDISRFKMDKAGNLRVGQSLRDLRRTGVFPEYRITIKAEDETKDLSLRKSATTQVAVKVNEANDYAPQFQTPLVTVSISEATAVGSRVTKLQKVESTVNINIDDVNDNAPKFTQSNYDFTLMENATIGQSVGHVTAVDKDSGINGKITYSLSGKGSEFFGIKSNGDIIVKRLNKLLDKEQNDNIVVQVKATDAGIVPNYDVSSINIEIIDVNDNPPVFSRQKYQGYIDETDPSSSKIPFVKMEQKIEAKDADKTKRNQNIRYSLAGPGSTKFTIHPVLGTIRVKKTSSIDCETKCEYRLAVTAQDQLGKGLRGQATLLISVNDINDNVPYFEDTSVIHVEPRTKIGTKLKTLKAIDKDVTAKNNKVIYILKSGGAGKFQVNFETGDLITVDTIVREPQQETYTLNLQIIDSGEPRLSSNGQLIIHTTVNKPPIVMKNHNFEVPENVVRGFTIGKINASDPNTNTNVKEKLKFSISDSKKLPFTIDENSGELKTNSFLDAEASLSYTFEILVSDDGYPTNTATTTVKVNLIDVNDNSPRFSQSSYYGSITEDNTRPMRNQNVRFMTPLIVTDSDVSHVFQTVKFQLRGNKSKMFRINASSGEITVNTPGSIDCENYPVYNITIVSYNVAENILEAKATLIINVTDVNDNNPVFSGKTEFQTYPTAPINSTIGRVIATDDDYSLINNQIDYFLLNGSFDKFRVDKKSGDIIITDHLSREPLQEEYLLNILAEDSGNPKQSSQTQIRIKIPLNKPPILSRNHQFEVEENVKIGSSIGFIEVEEDKTGSDPNSTLEFRLDKEAGPFYINKTSGEIKTHQRLDAETMPDYQFLVIVVDQGIPQHTATTSVNVIVKDINDNPPKFNSPFGYKSYVSEGFQGSLPIQPDLHTSDADITEENRLVTYSLQGNGSDSFIIDSKTAKVSLKQGHHLDSEKRSNYFLNITATNHIETSESSLEIIVQDLNDHSPEFLYQYEFNVGPKTKVGTIIGQLEAVDKDQSAKNNQFGFFLQNGSWDKFSVDTNTGEIKVADDLTREPKKRFYELAIRAIDFGYPSLSSNTIVKIEVPINKPVIIEPNNIFHVSEGVGIGTKVGTINATDPDGILENNQTLKYVLINNNVPFEINDKTGVIVTTTELDTESISTYQFEVIVLDKDPAPTTATATVTVVVEDINDNAPILSSSIYRATLVENQTISNPSILSLKPSLSTEDKDKNPINRQVRYFLKGTNSSLFKMNPKTGIIRIKDTSVFDAESQDKYILQIVAYDGIFRNKSKLVIKVEDINDNPPVFPKTYSYQVGPLTAVGTRFGKVQAEDNDSTRQNNRLLYVMTQGSTGKFGVDFITGELYVSSNLTDPTQGEEYNLVIQAFDTGEPSLFGLADVKIRVILNKPPVVNDTYIFFANENNTAMTDIGRITVFDPDQNQNDQQEIIFMLSDITDTFTINSKTGLIQSQTVLDRERQEQYLLTLAVINIGAPTYTVSSTVKIMIEDINDNKPIFKSTIGYYGTYTETDLSGIVKLNQEILANDADARELNRNVVYKLTGEGAQLFDLNSKDRSVRVRNPVDIRCDVIDTYNLKVLAIDQGGLGHKTETNLTIDIQDINDNAPIFLKEYKFEVPVVANVGTVVGAVKAIDSDCSLENNRITYLLKDGGFGKFKIDPDKGDIIVADNLVREPVKTSYRMKVKAIDNGASSLSNQTDITIFVPINQHPTIKPTFHFYVLENKRVGLFVGKILADDPDFKKMKGEKLTYFIDDKSVPFAIDSNKGSLRSTGVIDREVTDMYDFKVYVKDNGIPAYTASTKVVVTVKDINDNPPLFLHGLKYEGRILEDDQNPIRGQKVELSKNITVIDKDATLENRQARVSLKGLKSELFKINPRTGTIYVARPGKIDREIDRRFSLKVVATDQNGRGLTSEADLTIYVQDINDYKPRFVQSSYEFSLPSIVKTGHKIGQLIAIDRDSTSPNNKLLYILESDSLGKFKLDIKTGILTLLEGFFSKPRHSTYTLTVAAMDMGYPSWKTTAEVIINAPFMVYNDHPPKFEGHNVFIIKEEMPVGSLVGTLRVTDEDMRKNNSIQLSIDPEDKPYVPFMLKNDGSILTTEVIDRDSGYEHFRFGVHATDSGNPPLHTRQEVGIIVNDVNDNPPRFTMDTYQHMVSTNFPASTIVATPFAFDDVDKTDSVYQYKLLGQNPGYFYINDQTGVIRTTDQAKSLKAGQMEYTIFAQDMYNKSLTAEAKLIVEVMQRPTGKKFCCKVPC